MLIGYHASHEQFAAPDLLRYARLAEQAGFQAAMCSDHFNPWSERQGNSGFAWSWLGSALEATQLSFGTVCAPGDRYHPAVIAQAAATLTSMYPGRFWLSLGSGEQLNEHITGRPWPPKPERNQRLRESAEVIRRLLRGEEVEHDGLVRVDRTKLYVVPEDPPPLYAAALTPETAEWAGEWGDGLILAPGTPDNTRELIKAFRSGGGEEKPVLVQVAISYAATEDEATGAAHDQWRHAALEPAQLADLPTPAAFDEASEHVNHDEVREAVFVSPDLSEHVAMLKEYAEAGAHAAYVHNVSRDQRGYIEAYGREVLPALGVARSAKTH